MWTVTCAIVSRLVGLILVLLPASVLPGQLWGAQTPRTPHSDGAPHGALSVRIHEGRLSLTAQEASLTAIFAAIGRQLNIEVVTRIPADERITMAFEQLSLAEALTRLRPYVNYLILEDAAKAPATIRQLIVVSKRAAGGRSRPITEDGQEVGPLERPLSDAPTSETPARPQPFRFEFNPAAVGARGR